MYSLNENVVQYSQVNLRLCGSQKKQLRI